MNNQLIEQNETGNQYIYSQMTAHENEIVKENLLSNKIESARIC